MEEKWSYFSLKPHLRILRFSGYCALDSSNPPRRLLAHKIYMGFVLFSSIIFIIQHALKCYEARNDMNSMMDTLFLLFAYLGSIYKQILMLVRANEVADLLNTMKGDLFNQPEEKHHQLLNDTARKAKILVIISSPTAFINSTLTALYLVILRLKGAPVEFCFWIPFEADTTLKFYFAVFYYYIQFLWIAVSITTLDVFLTCFLHQCTTQINILRYDLENFVECCKVKSTNTNIPLMQAYDMKFKNMALHFLEIHKFFSKFETTFSKAIFGQFLFGAWILCTTAYKLVESEKLMDSAYSLDWPEIPVKHRRDLMLFMEMIKKPIIPMAGSVAPLANTTFVSIVKSSYTFYAFLKNKEN